VQVHGEFQLKLAFIMPWVSNGGGRFTYVGHGKMRLSVA
jgi:hypothetical protein